MKPKEETRLLGKEQNHFSKKRFLEFSIPPPKSPTQLETESLS